MATDSKKQISVQELLQDQMIIQLGIAGLTQRQIREIVGVDMSRVSRIMKHFNRKDNDN